MSFSLARDKRKDNILWQHDRSDKIPFLFSFVMAKMEVFYASDASRQSWPGLKR